MNARAVITIWIFAVVASIIAMIVPRDAPASVEAAASIHDVAIPVDDVDRVSIRRIDEDTSTVDVHEFERGPDGWRQTLPFEVRADGFAVRQLVVAAADLRATRRWSSEDPIDRDRVGLAADGDQVTLDWPGGGVRIDLGDRTVAGRGWIRLGADGPVFVVDGDLHERALDDDLRNWRSRRLFPSDAEFGRVEVRNGPVELALERTGRIWSMLEPIESRSDPAAVERFLGVLGRIEHDGFVVDDPDDLSRFGLESPPVTIEVRRADGTVERIMIGGPAGLVGRERFALVEGVPSVLRLDDAAIAGLLPAVEDLLATTGTGVRRGDVRRLVIGSSDGQIALDRRLDRWRITVTDDAGTREGEADPRLVERLLDLLTETRATEVRVQDYPTSLEVATVVLHGFDGSPMDSVRIARERNAGRWAFENGDGVLRLHPPNTEIPLRIEDWTVFESQDP